MLTLRELRSQLDDTDLRTKIARAAQRYVASKGYSDSRPVGTLTVSGATYFYYVLSGEDGLTILELEVSPGDDDELGREFVCRVTAHQQLCSN